MTADPAQVSIFSGAGLSASKPAALPLGFVLRDLLLDTCHEEACAIAPTVADATKLAALKSSPYKLEVVLGRIAGTVGPVAVDVLSVLDLAVPNEGHMLAALALAHGGVHVTANLDEGIELAYGLLTGAASLPVGTDPALIAVLPSWQALVPADPPGLTVVASHAEFDTWARDRPRPALLKIHGSIRTTYSGSVVIIDPVVEDEVEYVGLTQPRLAALDELVNTATVVITGYSGLDIDVYDMLIQRLKLPKVIWAAPDIWPRVQHDVMALPQGRLVEGTPYGFANVVLRDVFGWNNIPDWPDVTGPSTSYQDRAAAWTTSFRSQSPRGARAEAYAWFLADIGHHDAACALLTAVHQMVGTPNVRLRNRLADVLYERNAPGDRRVAAGAWAKIVFGSSATTEQKAYSWTRLGEIGRGVAAHGPAPLRPLGLLGAVVGPSVALALTRNGVRDPREAARALSSLSGLGLRVLESLSPRLMLWARPVTRRVVDAAESAGSRAQMLNPSGNRLLFVRQQRHEIALFACMLAGEPAPPAILADLRTIQTSYERAGDIRGTANVTAALALAAIVDGDAPAAKKLLDLADKIYADARPSQPPDPSGIALTARRRLLAQSRGLAV